MIKDPAIQGLIKQGKIWECGKCGYISNVQTEHFYDGCFMCKKKA